MAGGAITVGIAGVTTIRGRRHRGATMTFGGTQAAINAAVATFSYRGDPTSPAPTCSRSRSTDMTALQDVDRVTITVNPVNDAPVATAPANYAAAEQTLLTLHGTGSRSRTSTPVSRT